MRWAGNSRGSPRALSMVRRRILLTGGTGFIGGHVRALLSRRQDLWVRALVRHDTDTGADEVMVADLTRPESLRGVCDGVDVVMHLASCVGGEPELCTAVNERGTGALIAEAHRVGVPHLVYLSTAAVYGRGPHRGVVEGELVPDPISPTSASRLAAERLVRAAGGIVLRPMFVCGSGDRWFVPGLLRQLRELPFLLNGGTALLSMIAVEDLARLFEAIAATPQLLASGEMYHANHPQPVRSAELVGALTRMFGFSMPSSLAFDDVIAALGAVSPRQARTLSLTAFDHWYASDRLWELLSLVPGPRPDRRLAEYASWYRTCA